MNPMNPFCLHSPTQELSLKVRRIQEKNRSKELDRSAEWMVLATFPFSLFLIISILGLSAVYQAFEIFLAVVHQNLNGLYERCVMFLGVFTMVHMKLLESHL